MRDKDGTIDEIIRQALEIRMKYHTLEQEYHGSEWSVEEDALAYLTDAGLVGRNVMANQGRWPNGDHAKELSHKLAENIWWLIVLADRSGVDIKQALRTFLKDKQESL